MVCNEEQYCSLTVGILNLRNAKADTIQSILALPIAFSRCQCQLDASSSAIYLQLHARQIELDANSAYIQLYMLACQCFIWHLLQILRRSLPHLPTKCGQLPHGVHCLGQETIGSVIFGVDTS